MSRWRVVWNHLRGRTCHACAYLDIFWSSGDGQVSKPHAFCRNPQSPHFNRPIPAEAWCERYQRRDENGTQTQDDHVRQCNAERDA